MRSTIQTSFNSIIILIVLPSVGNYIIDWLLYDTAAADRLSDSLPNNSKGKKNDFLVFLSSCSSSSSSFLSSLSTNSTISSKHQHWSKCSSIIITYSCYWCITCFISLPPCYINTIPGCCYLCIV